MQKPLTRSEKINLLNGIRSGARSISELLPVTYEVWREVEQGSSYVNQQKGITLTVSQYRQYVSSVAKNVEIILVRTVKTPIPLAFRETDVVID